MFDWRGKIADLVLPYSKIHIYAADPGAVATLRPIYEEAVRQNRAGYWFAEGWALQNAEDYYCPAARIDSMLEAEARTEAVIMGQQVDFEQAYERLKYFKEKGYQTLFVSDHWKDIATLFRPNPRNKAILPHRFLTPDQEAYNLQKRTLPSINVTEQEIGGCLEIFMHPGIEMSLERIEEAKPEDLRNLKIKYDLNDRTIIMLLDNADRKGTEILGFDWQNCLDLAIAYMETYEPKARLLVKPHPRQDLKEIKAYISSLESNIAMQIVEEQIAEPFIALCDEIWGMTTVLLVIAQRWGKPIRAFMANRTDTGALDSNAHIEPFVIQGLGDFESSRKFYKNEISAHGNRKCFVR